MNYFSFIKKVTYTVLFSVLILVASAFDANATHFRYGNITWKRVPNSTNQIEIKVSQAWRKSFYSSYNTNIGSIINTGYLYTGQGAQSILLKITSVNNAEDWFYGEFTTIVTYNNPGTYDAYFTDCCRISTLKNNNDKDFYIKSTITVGNGNDAPITTISPYINLAVGNTNATYQLASTDPNGDPITYSLTPNGTFGASNVQPSGLTVSPSGLITFNTNAAGVLVGNLYNANITVSDNKGAKTMIDFIIKTTQVSTPPAFNYAITPANSQIFNVLPGQALNFSLNATDADFGQSVAISAVGMPIGSTFTSAIGNPATANFSWTPTLSDLGQYVLHFTAMDDVGSSTPTVVFLNVTADPVFAAPTPGNNSIFCLSPGTPIAYTYFASDPDTSDLLTMDVQSGLLAGMNFSNALPVTNKGTATTAFDWTPTAAQWGLHLLTMRITDSYGGYQDNTAHFIVNNEPEITSTPITTVNVGTPYSYVITTEDLDLIYGDTVTLESSVLPSFLNITDNGDGTFTIYGTPTLADTGSHYIKVEIEDSLNHYNGTHCGHDYQIYYLDVLPCDITTTITGTTNNNIPGHANTIIFKGYGNQNAVLSATTNGAGPIQYNWSNGATTQNITVAPSVTTDYSLVITDANGCKDTAYYTVQVIDVRCGNKNDKVKICHKTGNGYNELCVAAAAVPAHLAHGDMLGSCMVAFSSSSIIETNASLEIYPNPSDDVVTIALSVMPTNAVMEITDINGRIVYTQKVTDKKSEISIKHLAAGWYMVNLKDEGIVLRNKLIKK